MIIKPLYQTRFGEGSKHCKTAEHRHQATGPVLPCLQPDLFAPRPPVTPGLTRFAVLGDAGSGTALQHGVAHQMNMTYQKNPFASVLVLGDNVYENGEPALFTERIQQPYQALFNQGVKFFPVLGNHDVRSGHGDTQLDYWGAPNYYQISLGDKTQNPSKTADIFAIDTTVFLPFYDNANASKNPFLSLKKAENQLKWLEKALADSTAKYKIVFGHYPLYSSGMHSTRTDVTGYLRSILEPMFQKYGVDLYLAGHEHHYEKSQPIHGVQHFVSGAGGRVRDIFYANNPPYPRDKAISDNHFMLFDITDLGLAYQAINIQGQVIDQGLIPPKTAQTNKPTPQLRFA